MMRSVPYLGLLNSQLNEGYNIKSLGMGGMVIGIFVGYLLSPPEHFSYTNSPEALHYSIDSKHFRELKSRADNGDGDAALRIALSYLHSEAILNDAELKESAQWLKRASDLGNYDAKKTLQELQRDVRGTDKEYIFK